MLKYPSFTDLNWFGCFKPSGYWVVHPHMGWPQVWFWPIAELISHWYPCQSEPLQLTFIWFHSLFVNLMAKPHSSITVCLLLFTWRNMYCHCRCHPIAAHVVIGLNRRWSYIPWCFPTAHECISLDLGFFGSSNPFSFGFGMVFSFYAGELRELFTNSRAVAWPP